MDFSSAIQAHTNWRLRLTSYCRGALKEKIDVGALSKDNVCLLGQWLYGEGQKYANDAQFKELIKAHADFHRCAASVAAMVEKGQASAAEAVLTAPDSSFGKLSLKVVGILMQFRTRYSGPGVNQ